MCSTSDPCAPHHSSIVSYYPTCILPIGTCVLENVYFMLLNLNTYMYLAMYSQISTSWNGVIGIVTRLWAG
jgi:hypothetical protein